MIGSGMLWQNQLQESKEVTTKFTVAYQENLKAKELKNTEIKDDQEVNKEVEQKEEAVEVKEDEMTEEVEPASVEVTEPIVYDNMTLTQLAEKLDRSLNSTIAGKGYLFASRSLELGIDPYLAVAIVLHETGCKWECSQLVKECNNVGGQKGGPTCGSGSYKYFATLEEGINGFLDNLYKNYYAQGLTTPELMNPKYAASTAWAGKIHQYMEEIKAK